MNQKSEEGLFEVLEKILKAAPHPMDAVEIYNNYSDVRERAANPNRVSDYLGNMWRAPKNLLVRLPAPRGEDRKTRWLYAWKGREKQQPDMSQAIAYDQTARTVLDKPNLHIEDDGRTVLITLPGISITIKQTGND